MNLTGIGILLMGIACVILAIYFSKVLNSFSKVLTSVDTTVEALPKQLTGILDETSQLLHNGNETLEDVNVKLGTLTPMFYIVGDVGKTTRSLTATVANLSSAMKRKKDASLTEHAEGKAMGGIYGTAAVGYYVMNKKKEQTKEVKAPLNEELYFAGESRADRILEVR